MSRISRSARLLHNAEAALISAIEIYNKPSFGYREETFAILALNAWELLLKAKVLEQHKNAVNSLSVFTTRQTAAGGQSKKKYVKLNRTGNKMTIGIDSCIDVLTKNGIAIPDPVRKNLEALTEIRDNAVHYINASPQLSKQVLEIGTACLRNFIELGKLWMDLDLSSYSLYLMPIGFLPLEAATAMTISNHEQKVVNYLAGVIKNGYGAPDQDGSRFARRQYFVQTNLRYLRCSRNRDERSNRSQRDEGHTLGRGHSKAVSVGLCDSHPEVEQSVHGLQRERKISRAA